MFDQYLQSHRQRIQTWVQSYLDSQKKYAINSWGSDLLTRLQTYATTGKMIRGSLVFLGYDSVKSNQNDDMLPIAAALELIHAGLLIHDDIMDHDELRRGQPSLHVQYEQLLTKHQTKLPTELAKSFAICAGDQTFFLAFSILAAHTDNIVQQIVSQYIQYVINAQMQDVYNGCSTKIPTLDKEILELYRYKTGEYSITLPLIVGATIAKANNETLQHLKVFGKNIGIAYQLIDDRLNIFGDPKITGKPIGTDFIEQKKTLYWYYLHQTKEGSEILNANANKELLSPVELSRIQSYITDSGIDSKITAIIETCSKDAKESIMHIPIKETIKDILLNSINYFTTRVT